MAVIPVFEDEKLQAICDILADTGSGLTGSEIGRLLSEAGIPDLEPKMTKRHRLYDALQNKQNRDRCGNNVAAFIQKAMNPVRYIGRTQHYHDRLAELNKALLFCGLRLGEDGKLYKTEAVATLSEADERASKLRRELVSRKVHPDVLRFCRAELLQDNYFHAVFETTKSIADKIREKSGSTQDGAELIDEVFGLGKRGLPMIAFNSLQTPTEKSEHSGFMNLVKGIFGAFRNVTAHAPKITWPIDEQDALDLLSMASLIHRRLDKAIVLSRL